MKPTQLRSSKTKYRVMKHSEECNPELIRSGPYFRLVCNCGFKGHKNYKKRGAADLWNSQRLNPDLTTKSKIIEL